jgi:hypothetical protein
MPAKFTYGLNSMKNPIIKQAIVFVTLAICAAFSAGVLFFDVVILKDQVKEISATEIIQELFLFATAALFFIHSRRQKTLRGGFILAAGFFGCMLIRELDALFDLIHFGAWVYFASLLALYSLCWAAFTPKTTLQGLNALVADDAFPVLLFGLVVILVFSRLMGLHYIWQAAIAGDNVRLVKNLVEEGTELFGYSLCLLAAIRLCGGKKSFHDA